LKKIAILGQPSIARLESWKKENTGNLFNTLQKQLNFPMQDFNRTLLVIFQLSRGRTKIIKFFPDAEIGKISSFCSGIEYK